MRPLSWGAYQRKADKALAMLVAGHDNYSRPIRRDGEWHRLGDACNVGGKLLIWMVERGLLERRYHYGRGKGVEAVVYDWYRPTGYVDLGDLWIE